MPSTNYPLAYAADPGPKSSNSMLLSKVVNSMLLTPKPLTSCCYLIHPSRIVQDGYTHTTPAALTLFLGSGVDTLAATDAEAPSINNLSHSIPQIPVLPSYRGAAPPFNATQVAELPSTFTNYYR